MESLWFVTVYCWARDISPEYDLYVCQQCINEQAMADMDLELIRSMKHHDESPVRKSQLAVINKSLARPENFREWACFADDVEVRETDDGRRYVDMEDMLAKPPPGKGAVVKDYVCPFLVIPDDGDWIDLSVRTVTPQFLDALEEAGYLASFESYVPGWVGPQVDWPLPHAWYTRVESGRVFATAIPVSSNEDGSGETPSRHDT
ncbi:hypothetical protein ACHAQH_002086 [Verticillium albo-atrum]